VLPVNHYQRVIEGLLERNIGIEKLLQLHRHQVAVREDALPDREAVPRARSLVRARRWRSMRLLTAHG
jgi:phage tail protein X